MYRRLFCSLFLAGGLCFSVWSQGVLDSIPVIQKKGEASYLVKTLAGSYNYKISYDYKLLPERIDSVTNDSVTLRVLLKYLFRDHPVQIRLIDDIITIFLPPDTLGHKDQVISGHCMDITLSGTILDELTTDPIAYASVFYPPTKQFAITNKDGYFQLALNCADTSQVAILSAWGYKNRSLPINKPIPNPLTLKGDYITLQDIIVLSVDPVNTVKESLESIEENYMDTPTINRNFFREVITKNKKLVAISEAVLDIYKGPYTDPSPDQVRLIKGRKSINTERMDTLFLKVKGSINSCLELDVAKKLPFFYNPKSFKEDYLYSYEGITKFNEDRVYKIAFSPRENLQTTPFTGILYINQLTHSLEAVDFSVTPERIGEAQANYVLKKNLGIKIQLKSADYKVQYIKAEDKYVLNYVRLNVNFRVKRSQDLFPSSYETISEMILTHFTASDFNKVPKKEAAVSNKILLDQRIEYDPDFWKGHNYLPYTESLIDHLDQLNLILEE